MIERFPDSLLDQIRAAVPITDVVGQYVAWDGGKSNPGRRDMWANCPLHGENSPSFHAQDSEGRFHCFGCGADGDHFSFLEQKNGWDFPTAVRAVAAIAGIDMPDEPGGERKPSRPPEHPRKGNDRPQPSSAEGRREITAQYDYTDRDGGMLYQVCRFQVRMPDGSFALNKDLKGTFKTFLQRRPSGLADGSWVWGLSAGDFMRPGPGKDWSAYDANKKANWPDAEVRTFTEGAQHTIYRHPAVEIAIAEGKPCLIVEGEKDAETAVSLGFCGTTNSSGSKHWNDVHASCFNGADVVICLDNDEAGARADQLAKSMRGIARTIRVLNFADHVPGFDHKGDLTDWVEKFGGTADGLAEIIRALPVYRPTPPSTFGATTSQAVAGSAIVYDWLVKGLIERHGVFIIAGESQAGKSFFVKDLGMKIARGIEYGGRRVRKGVVIHVAVEDGRGTKLRQKGYRQHHGISPDSDVPYVIMDPSQGQGFSLMSDDAVDRLIAEVKAWAEYYAMPVELIIIDTLSVATEGLDEINGAEAGKVLARVNRLRDATGAAVALVHHMNAQGTRVRGHSSIVANVPNVIEIRPMMTIPANKTAKPEPIYDGNGLQMRRAILTKNKNGLNDIKWTFVLQVVPLGTDEDGDPITTCVCAKATRRQNEGESDDRNKMSPDTKLVFDALQAAMVDAGQDMPSGTVSGASVNRCAPQAAFDANVRKTMTFTAPDTEIENRNKELATFIKRTTTTLINAGYMGRDNDQKIVWWTGKASGPRPRYNEPERPQEQPGAGIPADVMAELKNDPVPF